MDPLHICIALGPLAIYFLIVGLINLRARPFITSGAQDAAALGVGVMGLVIAGPMELFFPETAAVQFGFWVWALLIALYLLTLMLLVLVQRPRLVIYNIGIDQLRPVLAEAVQALDAESRWAGDCVAIPQLGVQFHFESSAVLRNVQLAAAGPHQNLAGWRLLGGELHRRLQRMAVPPNPYGFFLVGCVALPALAMITFKLYRHPAEVQQALNQMLRQ